MVSHASQRQKTPNLAADGVFADYDNHEHRHSGIAMLTPTVVHTGKYADVLAKRQAGLDAAYASHPERFVHGPPKATALPTAVYLNKPESKPEPEAHYS